MKNIIDEIEKDLLEGASLGYSPDWEDDDDEDDSMTLTEQAFVKGSKSVY